MKKKLSLKKLIILLSVFFGISLVLINIFVDFVPHTVKTEKVNIQPTTHFSTSNTINVKNIPTYRKSVNINTATIEELCTIKLIGETKAKAIIQYREKYGAFKDKKDIVKVYGIGEKTYEKIRDSICVN